MKKSMLVMILFFVCISIFAQNMWENPVGVNSVKHIKMLDLLKFNGDNYILYTQENELCENFLYFNKLDNTGQFLWEHPVPVSLISQHSENGKIIKTSDNNLMVIWDEKGYNDLKRLYVRKYNSIGQSLWSEKKLLSSSLQSTYSFYWISSNNGGVVVCWKEGLNCPIHLQVISILGNSLYNEEGLVITNSHQYEFQDMRLSGNELNLLIHDTQNYYEILAKLNIQNASENMIINIIQEQWGSLEAKMKILPDNRILASFGGNIRLMTNTGSVIWSNYFEQEDIQVFETINDNLFVILTTSDDYGYFKVRKMNLSGNVVDSIHVNYPILYEEIIGTDCVLSDGYVYIPLLINQFIQGDFNVPNAFIRILKYNILTNTLTLSNETIGIDHGVEGSGDLKKNFFVNADGINTSFIILKNITYDLFQGLENFDQYYFNTINHTNLEFDLPENLYIMGDLNFRNYSYCSEVMDNKVYYLLTKNNIQLLDLSLNQQVSSHTIIPNYSRFATSFLKRITSEDLLISIHKRDDLPYTDYYRYTSGAWVYNEQNGIVDAYEKGFTTQTLYPFSQVVGEANPGYWLASNPTNSVLLYKTEDDVLLWGNDGHDTGITGCPLSIQNGYLVTVSGGVVKAYKVDSEGGLDTQWPEQGVEISEANSNLYYQFRARQYLSSPGLLILWEEYESFGNPNGFMHANLINPANGIAMWNNAQNLGQGLQISTFFINNKLYVSYLDPANYSLKLKCFLVESNQLTLQWERIVSNRSVSDYDVKLINNRLIYAFSANSEGHFQVFVEVMSLIGNPDQLTDGFPVYISDMQETDPVVNDMGQNQAMVSFLGFNDSSFKSLFATLIDLNLFVGNEDPVIPVSEFKVYPNYPNPFNPSTTLAFEIDKKSPVDNRIYNIKGQMIRELASEVFEKGHHSLVWDGKNSKNQFVSSGIYFARVKNVGNEKTIRMILIK